LCEKRQQSADAPPLTKINPAGASDVRAIGVDEFGA
jgi:hypothetical protein